MWHPMTKRQEVLNMTAINLRHLYSELPPMNLEDLKAKTHHAWEEFHKLQSELSGAETLPAKSFEQEVEEYGSLTEEATWRKAYASLSAKSLAESSLEDPQYLIEFHLVYASQKWGWNELLPDVLAELAKIPEAAEAIADGLESIRKYGCEFGTTPSEIESFREILINGNPEKWGRLQPTFAA
jgi:hypothetical protein